MRTIIVAALLLTSCTTSIEFIKACGLSCGGRPLYVDPRSEVCVCNPHASVPKPTVLTIREDL